MAGKPAPPAAYEYVNIRRLLAYIEASLNASLQWVVFEPNTPALWSAVERSIGAFLNTLYLQGMLQGNSPASAYFVQCSTSTMTQSDIANGRLIAVVGVAAIFPAEFIILQIGLWTGQ